MVIDFYNHAYVDTISGFSNYAQEASWYIVDPVTCIIFFQTSQIAWEYDGQFSGQWTVPTRPASWSYIGAFTGVWIIAIHGMWQYDGQFSGSWLVSYAPRWEYDGQFSGQWAAAASSRWEYDGQFSGVWVPPGNVASEMCITGPGNPVISPTANLMF